MKRGCDFSANARRAPGHVGPYIDGYHARMMGIKYLRCTRSLSVPTGPLSPAHFVGEEHELEAPSDISGQSQAQTYAL